MTVKKIEFLCPRCKKQVEVKLEKPPFQILTCGHIVKTFQIKKDKAPEEIQSLSGKKLFPFQKLGVEFCEKANLRCLIADEMGLGKTVQSLSAVKKHPEYFPILIVAKSSTLIQWQYEVIDWINLPPVIIKSAKDKMIGGFKIYIISYDLLRRIDKSILPKFNLIILDECQQLKNHKSQRTNQIRDIIKNHSNENVRVIGLSGTPIKNRPSEYFPILNILHPDKFSNRDSFLRRFIELHFDSYTGGYKEGGLKDIKAFTDYTKDFIIRRTREEVLPDLPKISRNYQYIEFTEDYEIAYNKTVEQFTEYFEDQPNPFDFKNYSITLGFLAKMRQLTGLAKVEAIYNFVDEFLLTTDRKIVVFIHHLEVGKMLISRLENENRKYLSLSADLSVDERARVVEDFKSNQNFRVLIASTLSSGEGLNLQFCSDMIMGERQWNHANEEQAESRFCRIGQLNPITATYFIAVGTIDEMLTQLIEKKRAIFSQVMDKEEVNWDESSVIKELSELIYKQGIKNRYN